MNSSYFCSAVDDDIKVIESNRKISVENRESIRKYAKDNFDWGVLVKKYTDTIEGIING